MLEKLEIYPYQRITEPSPRRQRVKRQKKQVDKWKVDGRALINGELINSLKALFTIENLLLGIGAAIMARAFVLEEILPFIFAYAVAFGRQNKERSIIIGLLACLSFTATLTGAEMGINILTLFLLLGVINYIAIPPDKTWWGFPLVTISVLLLVKSLLILAAGFSFYQQMVVVFEAMIAGVLTFVFMVSTDVIKQQKDLVNFSFEDICAFVVLGIGIVMGLNDVYFAGLSISAIICRLGILIAAFLWGSGGGTMVGVMAGILPSISSSIFAQSLGMYAVSGLLAGLFKNFGRLGVIIGFMLGTLALSMFISETQLTILGLWETGIACLIFFLLPSSLKESLPIQTLGSISNLKENQLQLIDTHIKEAARSRIEHLASVFDELSSTFIDDRDLRAYSNKNAYLNYLYEEVSRQFCRNCSRYDSCWGRDGSSTSRELLDVFAIAENNEEVTYEECPVEFRRRCIYGREMVNSINHLYETLRLNEFWVDKLEESRGLVASQLRGVSQVIKDLAEEIEVKTFVDLELRRKLLKESKKLGLNIKDITPVKMGEEQVQLKVVVDACADGQECELNLAPTISSLMGEKMEVCQKNCPRLRGQGKCEFTLSRSFTYRVTSGAAQVGKEEICGDSFTIATLKEGRELIALSDGMGVGKQACNESQAAVRLLENLLNSGFDKETALKTINSVLLLRSHTESFATLDMVMIDLYNAEVDFIKTGSAPSFIKRGNKVGVINSNSLPVGIMDNIDITSEKRSLCPRDMLVIVSDGVLEVSRDIEGFRWLENYLAAINETDPQAVAEMILNKALTLCKGKPYDDMTVICVYIDLNFPH